MPLVRQRPQRLAEHAEVAHPQRRLAGLGDEPLAFDTEKIADVEQLENFDLFGRKRLRVEINLDAPGQVAEVEKVRLAEIAVRGDAAGDALHSTLGKLLARLRHRPIRGIAPAERIEPARPQRVEFAAAIGEQFVFGFVHEKKPARHPRQRAGNVRRWRARCQRHAKKRKLPPRAVGGRRQFRSLLI